MRTALTSCAASVADDEQRRGRNGLALPRTVQKNRGRCAASALDFTSEDTICYMQSGAHMNLVTRGAVRVSTGVKTRLAALGEPFAGIRLTGRGRRGPADGAMP